MKKERGITLVALVVTIIVLLILAGVTIGMATSSNAADTWNQARGNENDSMDSYNEAIQNAYSDYVVKTH